jgi:hypothetical protein
MSTAEDRVPFVVAAHVLRTAGHTALANELEHGCLRLKPGEPFFVLRAQDVTAPGLVDEWARQNLPTCSEVKIESARDVAHAMRTWGGPRKDAD